jgi:hypothetical protein
MMMLATFFRFISNTLTSFMICTEIYGFALETEPLPAGLDFDLLRPLAMSSLRGPKNSKVEIYINYSD